MRWNTPEIAEISCAMEINMYFPAEDERGGDREDETFASPAADEKTARSAAGR